MTSVRALGGGDFDGWSLLWLAYLRFYRSETEVPSEVTADTFDRLVSGRDGLTGLVAVSEEGLLVGLAHAVFHPSTWSMGLYCYLEDLYVTPTERGTGAGAALIRAVYEEADRRGAARTYWETQEFNSPARSLYDKVARRTSFIIYER
ncbi:MAG: GNAT family N-acetyltransferase [Acidimicrobiales bacterium]